MTRIPEDKRFKVVRPNRLNDCEDLYAFYKDIQSAEKAMTGLLTDHRIKNTDVGKIRRPVYTDYEHHLRALIPDNEWERVMGTDAMAEIGNDLITCGTMTYYNLSRMIDKDWTVIDIGCSYNAQSYLFQDHARHIAVEPPMEWEGFTFGQFQAPGTELIHATGQEFIRDILPSLDIDPDCTFAICNYVPDPECTEMVRRTFKNVWCNYPASPKNKKIRL